MANPIKGEIDFSVEGQPYTLALDLNALCEAEPFAPGIMDGGDLKSLRAIRAVFWAGLRRHHPQLLQEDAGNLMQAIGMKEAGRLIGEGMKLAFGGGEGAARPPKASGKSGTGKSS